MKKKYFSNKIKASLIVAAGAIGTAGVIGGTMSAYRAHAENMDFSVTVEPNLAITITAGDSTEPTSVVSLDVDPATGALATNTLTATVGTNNPAGYSMKMTAGGTDLTRTESVTVGGTTSTPTIPTLAAEVTEADFKSKDDYLNRWGYRFGSGNYLPFVTTMDYNSSKTAVNADAKTITFGARADTSTYAGTYELALTFTATANPNVITMQSMDGSQCVADQATTAIDERDDKSYTVQRLADGKCWMTSNLNLAGGTKLYSDSSNVPDGYPESGGNPYYTLPASSTSGFSDNNTAYVYNSGKETTQQSDCTSTQACNSYYSWLAATAGGKDSSGNAVTGDGYDTAYSVCPKGWRLPTSGKYNDSSDSSTVGYKKGDFYKMITSYTGGSLANGYYENKATFYNNAGPNTTPNFLLAGNYYSGSFYYGGSRGYYWSASSYSSADAYYLHFYSGYVRSADRNNRRVGYSVRCVLAE